MRLGGVKPSVAYAVRVKGIRIMPIVWQDSMSVGNSMIDNDHQELISIINMAEEVINQSGSLRDLQRVLARLDSYVKEHFAREEALQAEILYPYREGHEKEHVRLLHRLNEIRGRVDGAHTPYNCEEVFSGLAELLRNWLMRHILDHDMRMKPYIERCRSAAVAFPAARGSGGFGIRAVTPQR